MGRTLRQNTFGSSPKMWFISPLLPVTRIVEGDRVVFGDGADLIDRGFLGEQFHLSLHFGFSQAGPLLELWTSFYRSAPSPPFPFPFSMVNTPS